MAVKILYNIGSQHGGNGYSNLFLGITDDSKKFLLQVEQTGDPSARKWMYKTRSWAKTHLSGTPDLYIDSRIKLDDLLDDTAPSFVGQDGVIADATITNAGLLKAKTNDNGSVPVFSLLGEGVSAPNFDSTDITDFTPLKKATASGFVSSITTFIDQNPVTSLVGFILLVLFIIYVVAPWLSDMNKGKKKRKR